MAGRRSLPDLVTRVLVDDTQLRKVGSTATGAGTSIKQGLDGTATPAIARSEAAYKRLSAASLSTTTVVSKGLQTATQYTTSYGSALTKQESRYASVQLGALGVTKAERDLSAEGSSVARAMGTMGEQGASLVGRFSSLAGVMGAGGPLGIAIGAGIVGLGLATAGAKASFDAYFALTDEVRQYAALTGQSAEASSRQVGALKELGVDAGTADKAMFLLDKTVAAHPDHLQKLGVAIATTKDGEVDLNGTLLNIIDAWNATTDATKRSQIAFTAFGRGGSQMIPVLEAGSAKLKQLEADIHAVFTDEDLAKAKAEQIHLKEVGDQFDQLKAQAGGFLAEQVDATVTASQDVGSALGRMVQQYGLLGTAQRLAAPSGDREALTLAGLFDKARSANDAMSSLAQNMQDQAQTAQQASDDTSALVDSLAALSGAQSAVDRANQAVALSGDHLLTLHIDQSRAQLDVTDKTKALKDAVSQYGSKSEEAAKASLDLQSAQILLRDSTTKLQGSVDDQRDTILTAATAAGDLADKVAKLTGNQDAGTAKADAFRQKLAELEKGMDANSPLRQALDSYIATLAGIPDVVQTDIIETYTISSSTARAAKGKTSARQFGGPVQPNRDYIVGEAGAEILRMGPNGSGTVYPHGVQPPPTGAGAPINITQHFNAAGMSPWDISRELAWTFKRGLR